MYFSRNKNGVAFGKEYDESVGGRLQVDGKKVEGTTEAVVSTILANTTETEKTIAYPSRF